MIYLHHHGSYGLKHMIICRALTNVVPRTPAAYLCYYWTLISTSLCAYLFRYYVIWAHCFDTATTWSRSPFCYSDDLLWTAHLLHQCDVHNLEPNSLPFSIHHSLYLYIHVPLVTFLIRPLTNSRAFLMCLGSTWDRTNIPTHDNIFKKFRILVKYLEYVF